MANQLQTACRTIVFVLEAIVAVFPQTVYCWGSILERKELATLTGRAPELCGWALWLGLVLLLSSSLSTLWLGSVAGPCPPLGRAPGLCQLCGWALWLGSVAGPCPPLVLLVAAPLNSLNSVAGPCPPLVLLVYSNSWLGSVARLCVRVLSSSCPCLGRAPELCGWALWPGSASAPFQEGQNKN